MAVSNSSLFSIRPGYPLQSFCSCGNKKDFHFYPAALQRLIFIQPLSKRYFKKIFKNLCTSASKNLTDFSNLYRLECTYFRLCITGLDVGFASLQYICFQLLFTGYHKMSVKICAHLRANLSQIFLICTD